MSLQVWAAIGKAPATRPLALWPHCGQLSTETLHYHQHCHSRYRWWHFVRQIPLPPQPFGPFFNASKPPPVKLTTQVASPRHGQPIEPSLLTVATKIFADNATYPGDVSATLWLFFGQSMTEYRWAPPPSHSSLPLSNCNRRCFPAMGTIMLVCLRSHPPIRLPVPMSAHSTKPTILANLDWVDLARFTPSWPSLLDNSSSACFSLFFIVLQSFPIFRYSFH